MNFKVIKPSWEYRADGALAMKDAGVALLEFAPAQQGSGTAPGERRYDWENKTVHTMQLCSRQSNLPDHFIYARMPLLLAEHCLESCRAW